VGHIVSSPNAAAWPKNFLYGVTCVSASDCWAVGFSQSLVGTSNINQTLIERWDGTAWAIVSSPNTNPTQNNYLDGVTCVSASNCWAVGRYYTGNAVQSGVYQTLIERWDGTSWAIVTSPNTSTTQYNYLFGVTCVSASECWAVGLSGTSLGQTLIERWDGTSWAIVTSPNTSATLSNFLYGVTCVSATDCWAVGYYYNGSVSLTLTEHYTASPPIPTSVVSRKTHGTAGTFDVDLPLTGSPGIECRNFQDTNSGRHQIVITFAAPVTVNGSQNPKATLTAPNGGSVDTVDVSNSIVTVNLKEVGNQQTITLTLLNVSDGTNSGNVVVPMGVLLGDVNASGDVDSADVFLVRQQTLHSVTSSNFREDINVSGDIDSADVFIARKQTLTSLP